MTEEHGDRSPAAFVALTFALAVPFWVLGALVPTPGDAPVQLPLSALQLVTPLVAASILVLRRDGVHGLRGFLGGLRSAGREASLAAYVVIVGVMPLIYATAYVVMVALGRPLPDPVIALASIPVLLALFLVSAACEESGWTGYALDPLAGRWGILRAAVVLGLVWAVFHLVADLQGGHDAAWIVWHRAGSVALRVLLVCAYVATGRGMLAVLLMHTLDNVSWQLFPNGGSHYDPAFVAPITIGAALVAVAWVTRTRGGRAPWRGTAPSRRS